MDRQLDQWLADLKDELLKMSAAVEDSIAEAVQALVTRDDGLAHKVIEGNARIDGWEVEIEEDLLALLATQQPVASDLRLVAAMLKVNYDLERTNDQAVNIAQRALELNQVPLLKPLIDIPRMASITQGMIQDALDAFVRRDAAGARQVIGRDDEVDALRDQVFRELLTYMRTGQPDTIDRALNLILVSRHLERIGDHACNISENAVYLAEARIVRHQKDARTEPATGEDRAETGAPGR